MSTLDVKYKTINKTKNELIFDIQGDIKNGLDKSIINSIRRILLTKIECISLVPENIIINKNNTSMHNEFLKDRLSLIPLFIDPETYENDYLFELNVKNTDNPIMDITTENFNIYPINEHSKFLIKKQKDMHYIPDNENIFTKMKENPKEYFNMDKPLNKEQKDKIINPFVYKGKQNYILITELKLTNSETDIEEINLYSIPVKGIGETHARFNNVSKSISTFKINDKLVDQEFKKYVKINKISSKNKLSREKTFKLENSERYYHRDINQESYYYEFTIKSNHIYNPSKLYIVAINILINDFIELKNKINKINKVEDYTIAVIENTKPNIFKLKINNETHNTIPILQSYASRYFINSKSFISVLGFNNYHPLETTMILNIMIKENDYEKIQQINYIIEFINDIINNINNDLNILKNKWNI